MNTEIIGSYTEFCTAAHDELAAIARENEGLRRGGNKYWDDIADASSVGLLLDMCSIVRMPAVEEWPGVPQIDYLHMPEIENRIGRDILDREGPFKFEMNFSVVESLRNGGKPVNFAISAQGRAIIRAKVAEYIRLAKWRFFSEQQNMLAA